MSTFNDIQNALNAKLASISGLPTIFYENIQNTPSQGTSYLRPTVLPASSELYTFTEGDLHHGIYQIDIYTQVKKGTSPMLLLADAIRDGFRRAKLTSGSTTVFIQNISISPAQQIENWWHCYVEVNYLCVA